MNQRLAWAENSWPLMVECESIENVTIEKMQMNQKLTNCSVLARFHHTANRAQVGGVGAHHPRRSSEGDVLAGNRRHDARDVGAHPETLVADPVALGEVVDAAGAGEHERAEQERNRNRGGIGQRPETAHRLREICPGGGLDGRHDRHREEHERERRP